MMGVKNAGATQIELQEYQVEILITEYTYMHQVISIIFFFKLF